MHLRDAWEILENNAVACRHIRIWFRMLESPSHVEHVRTVARYKHRGVSKKAVKKEPQGEAGACTSC